MSQLTLLTSGSRILQQWKKSRLNEFPQVADEWLVTSCWQRWDYTRLFPSRGCFYSRSRRYIWSIWITRAAKTVLDVVAEVCFPPMDTAFPHCSMDRAGLSFLLPVVAWFSLAESQPRPGLETGCVGKASPWRAPANGCTQGGAASPCPRSTPVTKLYLQRVVRSRGRHQWKPSIYYNTVSQWGVFTLQTQGAQAGIQGPHSNQHFNPHFPKSFHGTYIPKDTMSCFVLFSFLV